ncbi:hypothetical protein M9H77_17125 [Catharanthus roseus]|uniref:Uncharacterized protein n=1 Tax=Catharanthus roseus TaxID=4058 RepID=A0ACC0B3Q2_CATRO|nr:hypothetical protein M9H77_17125 [Catharanthus roseus]
MSSKENQGESSVSTNPIHGLSSNNVSWDDDDEHDFFRVLGIMARDGWFTENIIPKVTYETVLNKLNARLCKSFTHALIQQKFKEYHKRFYEFDKAKNNNHTWYDWDLEKNFMHNENGKTWYEYVQVNLHL